MSCDSIFNGDTMAHLQESCLSTVSTTEETSIFMQQYISQYVWIICIFFSQRGECEFEMQFQDFLFTKGTGQLFLDLLMLSLCSAMSSAGDTTVDAISCSPLVRQLLELILGRNWIRHLAARTDVTDFLLFSFHYSSRGLVDVQRTLDWRNWGTLCAFLLLKVKEFDRNSCLLFVLTLSPLCPEL